jgi:hypothetical protein
VKRNIFNYLFIAVFLAAFILAVAAFVQNLRPIISIINSQKRIAGVLSSAEQIDELLAVIRPYKKFAFIFSAMYVPAVLFFAYMIVWRVLMIFNIKIPKFVMPLTALVNTILLVIVLFMVHNVGDGLGLAQKFETAANYYSWYSSPLLPSDSNITYFAPTFWTVIMPLVFFGVTPLIYGVRNILQKNGGSGDYGDLTQK